MSRKKGLILLFAGILLFFTKSFIFEFLLGVVSRNGASQADILIFPFMGLVTILSLILIVVGAVNLNKKGEEEFHINEQKSPLRSKKKLYSGFIMIIVGIATFLFGFFYMNSAECGDPFLCGFGHMMINFIVIIPISLSSIIYGLYVVNRNIKNKDPAN